MPKALRRGRPPGKVSRYRAIHTTLLQHLESGEWPVGHTIPSSRRLARSFHVGPKTVWKALELLKQEGRIRTIPGGKSVVTRRVPLASVLDQAVAVVTRNDLAAFIGDRNQPDVGQGIIKSLSKSRTSILVLQHSRWWLQESPQGLRDAPVKGILIPGPFPPAMLKQYESLGVPVVLIDQPPGESSVHAVTVDNFSAAFDATVRLLKLGHRRLAFVRSVLPKLGMIDPDAMERQQGFIAACKKGGLAPGHYSVFSAMFVKHCASIMKLVNDTPRFTAVLCAGEIHIPQIARAAAIAGLKIPRDLSVVTFRGTQTGLVDWSGPRIDFEAMGRMAVDLLDRRLRTPQRIGIKTEWHEGSTIAAAPSG